MNALVYPLEVRPSRIDGLGLWSLKRIPARRKIGELIGEMITQREARRRARNFRRIAIVELGNGKAIDATNGNEFRYINHSCAGNVFIRIFGSHAEFYARRDIKAGEELTCDYGESHHDGKLPCQCGAPNCRGAI
ncbi:MAG: SET domain-containing protein-lysine N-methyltransferase [Bryobacteraceae bacterium]